MRSLLRILGTARRRCVANRTRRRYSGAPHRTVQDPRHLLRRYGTRSGLHLVGDDGYDLLAPSDALAGPLRGGIPQLVPHLLRRTEPLEPLCAAAQLPAAQRIVAGLHGRPTDRRLRLGRLLSG